MLNKVVTFSDKEYFKYGKLFIKTRKKINADFVLYGPDLSYLQIKELKENDIEYKEIDKIEFETKMQFLKFQLMRKEIKQLDKKAGITFIDFDTLFLKDWGHIFEKEFDIGVTARNEYIKNNILRAYANGGVIFGKQTQGTKDACSYALKVMTNGSDPDLPEYDKIFKTLEENRPAHKTHKRETLRWWVDQVFLSALILKYFRFNKKGSIKDMTFYNCFDMTVGIFSCTKYNKLDPEPKDIESFVKKGNTYILHLKTKGRDKLRSIEKEIDKWMR